MCFPLFVVVLCLSLFCYALLCVHTSFAIILNRKRKLVALLLLSYRCIVTKNVLWLFLTVPRVGLPCVIVVFPEHTQLLIDVLCVTLLSAILVKSQQEITQQTHAFVLRWCACWVSSQCHTFPGYLYQMTVGQDWAQNPFHRTYKIILKWEPISNSKLG